MKFNRRRKRAIQKAMEEMEQYEDWKEWVIAVGGNLQKDKDGRVHGVAYFD